MRMTRFLALAAGLGVCAIASAQNWVNFTNETSTRLVAAPSVGSSDGVEKDYVWGDVDQDGDIDLVCVRKEIGSTAGKFRNVLFINEGVKEGHPINGVLVDRSEEYATSTTVPGDNGFLTPTADRDADLVDVDNDGWLDIVTATTYGSGQPKHISHPRIYINLGNDEAGNWRGFRFEDERFPQLIAVPTFCDVGSGDVDDDGDADLYFADYGNLEDRLLINQGGAQGGRLGFFADETETHTFGSMLNSVFANAAIIADMNGDGFNDIVKNSSLGPYQTTVAYNNPFNPGFFTTQNWVTASGGSTYFAAAGDLNHDDRLDLVIVDDGVDRYLINNGNATNGHVNFMTAQMPNSSSGFGGNITISDLDRDGLEDVMISDVDVDGPSCGATRLLHIYRHRNGAPITNLFDEPPTTLTNADRQCTFDVAAFDLNGDHWDDLVIGRYSGTTVWIQVPPTLPCPADLDGDGEVGLDDLGIVLAAFGVSPSGDIDGDGETDLGDLGILLANFGPCQTGG